MDYSDLAKELLLGLTKISQTPAQKEATFFACGERFLMRYLAQRKIAQPSEISAVMGTSTARTAKLLCVLEMKGYIRRRPDKNDLRRIIVTPTKSGLKYIDGEEKRMQLSIEQMLRVLGEEDAEACVRIVKRVADIENLSVEG